MRLVEGLLRQWQHHTCKHRWVRARWEDGSYGLRCSQCMQPYGRTWNDLIATPAPGEAPAPRQSMEVVAGTPKLGDFHSRQLGDAMSKCGRPLPGNEAQPQPDQREGVPRKRWLRHRAA